MVKCSEEGCGGNIKEKFWGGNDIRAVCNKCGNTNMRRKDNGEEIYPNRGT
jgi:hypothetical protein